MTLKKHHRCFLNALFTTFGLDTELPLITTISFHINCTIIYSVVTDTEQTKVTAFQRLHPYTFYNNDWQSLTIIICWSTEF